MERIEDIGRMREKADALRRSGKRIGFVPTMGYLHEGHLSLMDEAKKDCDVLVVSIFVNPAQFGPNEDYTTYPRNILRDEAMAAARGADIIFYPSADSMYPGEQLTWVTVDKITNVLCGAQRPGHFRGVATVVAKLFHIVKPHVAVFGQKDAQQLAVIMQMVRDLNMDVEIRVAPVIREADGLAMSSRNAGLAPEDRKQAVILSQVLFAIRDGIKEGKQIEELLQTAGVRIASVPHARLEYLEARTYPELELTHTFDRDCLIAIAVRFGKVRLIDNVLLKKT